jgi:hypothetical protein
VAGVTAGSGVPQQLDLAEGSQQVACSVVGQQAAALAGLAPSGLFVVVIESSVGSVVFIGTSFRALAALFPRMTTTFSKGRRLSL